MIETLTGIDQRVFLILNGLRNPFLDFVMYWATNGLIWLPVYIILLYLVIKVYRRETLFVLIFTALLITLTDQMSVHLFKEVFMRLRPCHEPSLAGMVHTMYGKCGGDYGFVSSHAANFFGIAVFMGLILRKHFKRILLFLCIWAALISYSRIYLGVHYPGDILCGALLGAATGTAVYTAFYYFCRSFLKYFRPLPKDFQKQ